MLSTSVLIVLPHLQLGRKEQQQTLNKSLPFSDAPDNKMICPSLLPLLAIDLSNLEEYNNSFPLWKAACGPGPYVYHEASAEEESKSPLTLSSLLTKLLEEDMEIGIYALFIPTIFVVPVSSMSYKEMKITPQFCCWYLIIKL